MVTDELTGMLLVLPEGRGNFARVICCGCKGEITIDLRAWQAVTIIQGLSDEHECPTGQRI